MTAEKVILPLGPDAADGEEKTAPCVAEGSKFGLVDEEDEEEEGDEIDEDCEIEGPPIRLPVVFWPW